MNKIKLFEEFGKLNEYGGDSLGNASTIKVEGVTLKTTYRAAIDTPDFIGYSLYVNPTVEQLLKIGLWSDTYVSEYDTKDFVLNIFDDGKTFSQRDLDRGIDVRAMSDDAISEYFESKIKRIVKKSYTAKEFIKAIKKYDISGIDDWRILKPEQIAEKKIELKDKKRMEEISTIMASITPKEALAITSTAKINNTKMASKQDIKHVITLITKMTKDNSPGSINSVIVFGEPGDGKENFVKDILDNLGAEYVKINPKKILDNSPDKAKINLMNLDDLIQTTDSTKGKIIGELKQLIDKQYKFITFCNHEIDDRIFWPMTDRSVLLSMNESIVEMVKSDTKKIKLFEEFNLNESRFKGYDDMWIPSLEGAFDAKVKVDKTKQAKPIYGGGTYDFIGYNVETKSGLRFILEGLQVNGCFAVVSVILFKGDKAIMHGGIDIEYRFKDTTDKNIAHVIEETKKFLKEKGKPYVKINL